MQSFIQEVAAEYAAAPLIDARDVHCWRALAVETMPIAERLKGALRVSYTVHAEPYPDAYTMLRDIAQGRVVISLANAEHPVWSLEENTAFRLVHDVVGHGSTGSGFDFAGEWRAYEKHYSIVRSAEARRALFTEAIGQAAYAVVHGAFTVQKCALLPTWMQWGPAGDPNVFNHGVGASGVAA